MVKFMGDANEAPIRELYAFVSTDDMGNDGICGFQARNGTQIAMVTSKEHLADTMKPMAQDMAKASGMTIKLIKMSVREDLWETT